MSSLEQWVARRNVTDLKRRLEDCRFDDIKVELLRQLATEELKVLGGAPPPPA